ncbi:MAG: AbrB/MazE/SpoVT family DNA-binding domain-containing protein [Chitinophagia bacterium]|nr:AbrB/MazE/SpoVT family DNA-binding domain-containing protein [Chitinophagia bacterium]
MEISLITIGNSKGIRIPKKIIEQYNMQNTLELILKKEYIIIKPKHKAREGWEKSFQQLHANGDDQLMIPDVFTDENWEE